MLRRRDLIASLTGSAWLLTQDGSGGKQTGAGSGPRLNPVNIDVENGAEAAQKP